jgi:hypothetical protein
VRANGAEYVLPLHCIGDSHTEMLNGLLLRDAKTNAPLAVGTSMYAIPTAASAFSDPQAGISATLIPLLYAIRVLGFAKRTADAPTFQFGQHLLSVHPNAQKRWVMLFAGEFDARFVIESVPLDATIALPDFDLSPFAQFSVLRVVAQQSIEAEMLKRLQPLIDLVKQLRMIGIARVALTSIPPPTLDDAEYRRLTGIESRASTRYAVHWLLNRVLASLCAADRIAFVDTWPLETENNIVRPGFLLDNIHLGREAAVLKLRAYYELVQADGSAEVVDVSSVQ